MEVKTKTNYIQLPVLIAPQYAINNKISIGLGVGPSIGFFLGGKTTVAGTETKIKANKDLIKTLKVRLNNANTSGVTSPKSD